MTVTRSNSYYAVIHAPVAWTAALAAGFAFAAFAFAVCAVERMRVCLLLLVVEPAVEADSTATGM